MNRLAQVEFIPSRDRRDQALYSAQEVARYIGVPARTLLTWVRGRSYRAGSGTKYWPPLIKPAHVERGDVFLSFNNMAEAHILASTRRVHGVSVRKIREGIDYVSKELNIGHPHPLLSDEFFTDGCDLMVNRIEHTVVISQRGQLGLKTVMDQFIQRVVKDDQRLPFKVYPLTRAVGAQERVIVMIAGVFSGRPIIDGFGISAEVVWERSQAGEPVAELSDDYGIPADKIESAISYFEESFTQQAA